MMPPDPGRLVIQFNGQIVQTVSLDIAALTIGRSPDNGLVLRDHTVSSYHAQLRVAEDSAILIDRGSRNGTVVDGVGLAPDQPSTLVDGSAIGIGPYVLIYRAPRPPRPAAPSMTTDARRTHVPDEGAPEAIAPPAPPAPPGRPTYAPPPLRGAASSYLRYLPVIFQDPPRLRPGRDEAARGGAAPAGHDGHDGRGPHGRYPDKAIPDTPFLHRYLLILESIWEPLEQRQDHIAMYFDPCACPRSFRPWLASLFGIALPAAWPEERMRTVVKAAMEIYGWRGTRYGLELLIRACTDPDMGVVITEDAREPFVFRIMVTPPPACDVDRTLIESLIQANKPAHAGYILEIAR